MQVIIHSKSSISVKLIDKASIFIHKDVRNKKQIKEEVNYIFFK